MTDSLTTGSPVTGSPVTGSLVTGAVPLAALLLGGALFLVLLSGRGSSWWGRRVPLCLAAGIAVTAVIAVLADQVWHPFADPIPTTALIWTGATLSGLALAAVRPRPWLTRIAAAALAVLIGVCGTVRLNAEFGTYPTLAAALGAPESGQIPAAQALRRTDDLMAATTGPLLASWTPPSDLPAHGAVTHVQIPGASSGFVADDAWIYLPPAYQTSPRATLPVLILLSGQPGEPRNWFDGSDLAATMDTYAAAHHGLAPVVVVPDWLGSGLTNPMCVDSVDGVNDFSYLTVDVRNWILANLQVGSEPAEWAVGGLSAGATCAVQIATVDPAHFPTFLAFSSQQEPTLGDHRDTVDRLFGGSEAAYDAINPVALMAAHRYPGSAGVFAAGAADREYGPQTKSLYSAALAAGMAVTFTELSGGHDSAFWAAALAGSMPWLGSRLGLTS